MIRQRTLLTLYLVVMGAGWGLTTPLTKIAVSEGYRHFGLIFWQLVISAVVLGAMLLVQGKTLVPSLNKARGRLFLLVALVGTILPDAASYSAAVHLPSGVLSVALSMVPMFAFGVAVSWGMERFHPLRLLGLLVGLVGVLLLTLPGTSMSQGNVTVWFLLLALFAPFCYGFEGNFVARFGTDGLDPVQTLFGASIVGGCFALPLAIATGSWISPLPPWGLPDGALFASSVIHALVYSSYVWMVGRAGPVFAGQVSYLVTGFGVLWAILLLGESYSAAFWGAFALMLTGLFLVAPKRNEALAERRRMRVNSVEITRPDRHNDTNI